MDILLIEPYFTGSHADWANGLQQYSSHKIDILSMKGQFWKWRMHGGAVTLARQFLEQKLKPDLIIATDMLDLSTFLALTRKQTTDIPVALYCHENQLVYPWSPYDRDVKYKRDRHYGFINYASALAADRVFFNSRFNCDSFLAELPRFLKHFPDYNEMGSIDVIKVKAEVLSLGLDLQKFDAYRPDDFSKDKPLILWNHRWEFDKNPEDFFKCLFDLDNAGFDFNVAVLGENFSKNPEIFNKAKERLRDKIVHMGFVESFEDYAHWLWQADILPVTSFHDFFGASVMEAVYCGCFPLLPDRLSYPELVPESFRNEIIYTDNQDLFSRVKNAIENIEKIKTSTYREIAAPFDWQNIIEHYDNCFENMM